MFILMNIWTLGKDLMKYHYLIKNNFKQLKYERNYKCWLEACKILRIFNNKIENFRDKCTEIYELDAVHFLSAPGLAWQAYLKKDAKKIRNFNRHCYVINGSKRN